jgi:hypothetical protein
MKPSLEAMRRANIKGALVGVEAVTPEKASRTCTRASTTSARLLVTRLRTFRER